MTSNCLTSCVAGGQSNYQINFLCPNKIPAGSRILIEFPATLTLLSYAPCTSNKVGVECSLLSSQIVLVDNITSDVSNNSNVILTFTSVQNPSVSGGVGNFRVIILEESINTIIASSAYTSGPVLLPGNVNSIQICPDASDALCTNANSYLAYSRGSLINSYIYTVQATTTNNIPEDGVIVIQFPSAITLITDTCQILSGLSNIGTDESNQVMCTIVGNDLEITKFAAFSSGTFSLKVRADNPVVSTAISTFRVTSYTSALKSIIIDQSTAAAITLDNISPSSNWDVQ